MCIAAAATSLMWNCGRNDHAQGAVIPKDSLITVLAELHLADAMNVSEDGGDLLPAEAVASRRAEVLTKHRITKDDFDRTMHYYTEHPDELLAVYDAVVEELTRIQSEAPR
ncbi:MAG: hypothetical protein RL213_779 [Bacteroidota bacterium]|jgi:hypothetical protein